MEDDRINVSREELDRQKLEIIKRLGLEVGEADVQRALEIGGKWSKLRSYGGSLVLNNLIVCYMKQGGMME